MVRRLVQNVLGSEVLLVTRFELRRTWGRGGAPRFFGHVALLAAAIVLGAFAWDRWVAGWSTYHVALYAQPAGLILQSPGVWSFWELPLWSMSPAHVSLAVADFLLLVWARIYLAVGAAAAIYRDRESVQEEMLALSRLKRRHILWGKVLAPVLPVATAAALVIGGLSIPLASASAPWWVPARAWLEVLFHSVAISAVCAGIGSQFRRRGVVLLASCAASVLGISAVLWGYGALVLGLRLHQWVGPWTSSMLVKGLPAADPGLSWMPMLCLGLLALALANVPDGSRRSRPRAIGLMFGTAALLAGATWIAVWSPTPYEPKAEPALTEGEVPALEAARDDLARHEPEAALRSLAAARKQGYDNQQPRILRVCALFDAGRYREARLEGARLEPFRITFFRADSYWAGMALCSLADGQPQAARDYLRALNEAGWRDDPALGNAQLLVRKAATDLLAMEPEYRLPIRGVGLRWAVGRFPEDRSLRTALRNELENWAGRACSRSARTALLNEASRRVAAR